MKENKRNPTKNKESAGLKDKRKVKEKKQKKAAKEAFSQIEGKLPTIRELNAEYNQVLQEKKKTYAEYRQAKKDMKDLQTAKYNVDRLLKSEQPKEQDEKQKTTEQTL